MSRLTVRRAILTASFSVALNYHLMCPRVPPRGSTVLPRDNHPKLASAVEPPKPTDLGITMTQTSRWQKADGKGRTPQHLRQLAMLAGVSSRLSRLGRRTVRPAIGNRGKSGSARLALETTLITHTGHWVESSPPFRRVGTICPRQTNCRAIGRIENLRTSPLRCWG